MWNHVHVNGWGLLGSDLGLARLEAADEGEVAAAAGRLLAGGTAAAAIADGVDQLGFDMADSGWAGAMADAYTDSWRTLVEPCRGQAETSQYAGRALSEWAETLHLLRADARRLLADVEATHGEWHQQDDRRVELLGEADDLTRRADRLEGVQGQEAHQRSLRMRASSRYEAANGARDRCTTLEVDLARLHARARQLDEALAEGAAAVARTLRANTPTMDGRVTFDGGVPCVVPRPEHVFVAAVFDTFSGRVMAELRTHAPELAEVMAGVFDEPQLVATPVVRNGLAAGVADVAQVGQAVLGLVGTVAFVIGSGGTLLLVGSIALGATEAIAGAVAGEPEHVDHGLLAGAVAAGGVVRLPGALAGVPGQMATSLGFALDGARPGNLPGFLLDVPEDTLGPVLEVLARIDAQRRGVTPGIGLPTSPAALVDPRIPVLVDVPSWAQGPGAPGQRNDVRSPDPADDDQGEEDVTTHPSPWQPGHPDGRPPQDSHVDGHAEHEVRRLGRGEGERRRQHEGEGTERTGRVLDEHQSTVSAIDGVREGHGGHPGQVGFRIIEVSMPNELGVLEETLPFGGAVAPAA